MNDDRLKYRPVITKLTVDENTSAEEAFQNLTLRPVIKMQHHLLLAFFKNYMDLKKVRFNDLMPEKRVDFIQQSFRTDVLFKTKLIGIIIGQFTTDEFERYSLLKNELNKRMLGIIKERLINSIDELY
jgi:hypothetical protein